jgi:hypothetical protein
MINKIKNFYYGKGYHPVVIGLSAASTWTWAPALILSTDIAANKGLWGMLSFIIPNIMALWIFAFVGIRINPTMIFNNRYIRYMYHVGFGSVEFFCVLIQVTAGANVVSKLIGWDYPIAAILFLLTGLLLASFKGLHGTIISNIFQHILLCILTIVLVGISQQTTPATINYGTFSFFDCLVYTVILCSAPIMTNQHWQRANRIGYLWAGVFFAIPLICLSILGLNAGITGQYVSLTLFADNPLCLVLLAIVILSGLFSTLQSALTSWINLFGCKETIKNGRIKMIVLVILALIIIMANIEIITLWKTMGTVRIGFAVYLLWGLYVYKRRTIKI